MLSTRFTGSSTSITVVSIRVENFPAFILIDDKGNDFFTNISPCPVHG